LTLLPLLGVFLYVAPDDIKKNFQQLHSPVNRLELTNKLKEQGKNKMTL
jgi:hypothetical protein